MPPDGGRGEGYVPFGAIKEGKLYLKLATCDVTMITARLFVEGTLYRGTRSVGQ